MGTLTSDVNLDLGNKISVCILWSSPSFHLSYSKSTSRAVNGVAIWGNH